MKELYSFTVSRETKKTVPVLRKNKKGETVEGKKTIKNTIKNRVIFEKPSVADVEDAEFFYGQKYNEFINAGFLTKGMLNKKIGDLGGQSSKIMEEAANKAIIDNIEAARTIEFYEGQENLTEEQELKLESAKDLFVSSRKIIENFENNFRGQYSQTAEAKAEQKLIEWFIFNFSCYEEDLGNDKTEIFPLFKGDSYEQKRETFLDLCEDAENMENKSLVTEKIIFDKAFNKLAMIVNIWYAKLADNAESIDQKLKEIFPDD